MTDLDGGSDAVRVVVLPMYVLPAVKVAAFPADPFVNTPVTLTATATDGDGAIAGLAWDLDDGDGFDDGDGRDDYPRLRLGGRQGGPGHRP